MNNKIFNLFLSKIKSKKSKNILLNILLSYKLKSSQRKILKNILYCRDIDDNLMDYLRNNIERNRRLKECLFIVCKIFSFFKNKNNLDLNKECDKECDKECNKDNLDLDKENKECDKNNLDRNKECDKDNLDCNKENDENKQNKECYKLVIIKLVILLKICIKKKDLRFFNCAKILSIYYKIKNENISNIFDQVLEYIRN